MSQHEPHVLYGRQLQPKEEEKTELVDALPEEDIFPWLKVKHYVVLFVALFVVTIYQLGL